MLLTIAPYFGYLASILLAIGLLINNDLKFRWLNTCGNIAFITYGVLLNALPVVLTNSILLTINLFYLYKIYKRKELFDLVQFESGGILIDKFISFYKADIANYFPDFKREQLEGNLNFVVLRDLVVANIFSTKLSVEGDAEVVINYTIPKYRDFKVGKFIFDQESKLLYSKGVRQIIYKKIANPKHKKFLFVSGFKREMKGGHEQLVKSII